MLSAFLFFHLMQRSRFSVGPATAYVFMVFDSSFKKAESPPVNAFSAKPVPQRCVGLGVGSRGCAGAPEDTITAPLPVLQRDPSGSTPSPSSAGHSAAALAVGTVLETPA